MFRPLPAEEYDRQQQAQRLAHNRLQAQILVERLSRRMPSLKATIEQPKRCPGCKQERPLIKHGASWCCRECSNKRDAYLLTCGWQGFVDTTEGWK